MRHSNRLLSIGNNLSLVESSSKVIDGEFDIDEFLDDEDREWNLTISYKMSIDTNYGADRDGKRGKLTVDIDSWKITDEELIFPTEDDLEPGEELPKKFDYNKLSQRKKDELNTLIYYKAVDDSF